VQQVGGRDPARTARGARASHDQSGHTPIIDISL
jgi:hypothetical protein